MKKLLSALVAIAFVAASAPAFAEETKADAPSAQKATPDSSKKSSKKKSSTKTTKTTTTTTTKTDDKTAAAPAK